MGSTVLAVTDLTSASYKLVGFAAFVAGPTDGEVILVSTYGGGGNAGQRSEPPPDETTDESGGWRERLETRLRQEGQLLERQRQWCADRGVRCRAELYEDGYWPDFVLQSAERGHADLILVGVQPGSANGAVQAADLDRLAGDATCPVSIVRLPALFPF